MSWNPSWQARQSLIRCCHQCWIWSFPCPLFQGWIFITLVATSILSQWLWKVHKRRRNGLLPPAPLHTGGSTGLLQPRGCKCQCLEWPQLLGALWGTQSFIPVFQHREPQPETGTGHDLNAKYSMKSMCLHAMGFLSSHHLLVQQMHIDQVLCGTSCNFSTESKSFSPFLKQLWPSERNALWRLLLSQLVALG